MNTAKTFAWDSEMTAAVWCSYNPQLTWQLALA